MWLESGAHMGQIGDKVIIYRQNHPATRACLALRAKRFTVALGLYLYLRCLMQPLNNSKMQFICSCGSCHTGDVIPVFLGHITCSHRV